jgi:hypothetical protein
MIPFILFLTLIGLPALIAAFAAGKLLRHLQVRGIHALSGSRRSAFLASMPEIAAASSSQLAPGAIDYAGLPIEQLLAAAEEFMRTDPTQIEYRRQQQIERENHCQAKQAKAAARKQTATQPQPTSETPQAQSIVADLPTQKPTKKAAKVSPTLEDMEALRKQRESLPTLPLPPSYSADGLKPSTHPPKIESSLPLPQQQSTPNQSPQALQQDSHRLTTNLPRPNLFQRTITLFTIATQRCQAMVQQTTRLAKSIPRIFNFLTPPFWRKAPHTPPCTK